MTPYERQVRMRVVRGAAWLSANCPAWVWRLDLECLDVRSVRNNVLAQLYHYLEWVPLDSRQFARLGFDVAVGGPASEYDVLTAHWREVVEELRDRQLAGVVTQ